MNKAQKIIWSGYIVSLIFLLIGDVGENVPNKFLVTLIVGWIPVLILHFIWREKNISKD